MYDLKIDELLSVLAALVNEAEKPSKSIHKAQRVLRWWRDTEYAAPDIRRTCDRNFNHENV